MLFPGAPIQLHIFEPRYREMIQHCLETPSPFGVVLIRRGQEALGPLPEPHRVGCTANILSHQDVQDGQLIIQAVGLKRFRLLDLHKEKAYLTGEVQMFPYRDGDEEDLVPLANRLRPYVMEYLDLLDQADALKSKPDQLPLEPLAMGNFASILVQLPPEKKQPLLAQPLAKVWLKNLFRIYQREIPLMKVMLKENPEDEDPLSLRLN